MPSMHLNENYIPMTLLFLYDYQRMTCDVRLQVASCDVKSQVAMCRCEPILAETCDVRVCGVFYVCEVRSQFHTFLCILRFCALKIGDFRIFALGFFNLTFIQY